MKELALHLLDIAENGIAAGAACIHLEVVEDRRRNRLQLSVQDDGAGIAPEMRTQVSDPFVTGRSGRRVGLGLALLEAAARQCDGTLTVASQTDQGTRVTASFRYDHIDRAPLGDTAGSLGALMAGYPEVEFVYIHRVDRRSFRFDTRAVKKTLGGVPRLEPAVIRELTRSIAAALRRLE